MEKLKVAVIGTGGIASNAHLPAWAEIDQVEVVAVCDIVQKKAKRNAEK